MRPDSHWHYPRCVLLNLDCEEKQRTVEQDCGNSAVLHYLLPDYYPHFEHLDDLSQVKRRR
jgi:hypothetical protein